MHWILAHLIGDYIFQTDWMAREKKVSNFACAVHVATYMIPFLFTGMAWIDYKQLDLNLHVRNGNITKERSKTKTRFCVPIHKRVDEILQRGKPIIADQAFNRQLKNHLLIKSIIS